MTLILTHNTKLSAHLLVSAVITGVATRPKNQGASNFLVPREKRLPKVAPTISSIPSALSRYIYTQTGMKYCAIF